MAAGKHINLICYLAVLFSLLITGLLMSGKLTSLFSGAQSQPADAVISESGRFTAAEQDAAWDSQRATKIVCAGDGAEIRGNGAYESDGNIYLTYPGDYVLSGELSDGSVIISANKEDVFRILLDGAALHCEDNAAFRIEQANKVYLTLADGSQNQISSGASYTEEAVVGKIDGALYSRDDLAINGSGSLEISTAYQHALVCNDNLSIVGTHLDLTAIQDGIHVNDSVRIAGADITIQAGDDGITVSNEKETDTFYMESGSVSIPSCYEGIEASDITISGGRIDISPRDDGINAGGSADGSIIRITGGDISIVNATGMDADGLDSNGEIEISGGNLFISLKGDGGNCAIDYGSESGKTAKISGGTVIAAGGSRMAEGFDADSKQGFLLYSTDTAPAGTTFFLANSAGEILLSREIPCSFSSLLLSSPDLIMGETCTLSIGEKQEEITIDNSTSDQSPFAGFRTDRMHGQMGQMPGQMGQMPGRQMRRDFSPDAQNGPWAAKEGRRLLPAAPVLLVFSVLLLLIGIVVCIRRFPDRV